MKKIVNMLLPITKILLSCSILLMFVSPLGVMAQTQTTSETVTINTDGTTSDIEQYDGKIYVGGNYQNVEVEGKKYEHANFSIVDVSTRTFSPIQHDINGPVEDILVHEGRIFVSGEFTEVDGKSHPYIVVFAEDTGEIVEVPIAIGGPVYSMASYNNAIYLGGNFENANNASRMNFLEYDTESNALTSWAPVINDVVYDLLVINNTLYVGGSFTMIDNTDRTQLAVFNLDTKELIDWAPQINGTVMDISEEDTGLLVVAYTDTPNESIQEVSYRVDKNTGAVVVIGQTVVTPTVPVIISGAPVVTGSTNNLDLMVDKNALGFVIPSLGDLLTFAVRTFFAIAGIAAMFYLLMGAFNWVISGGDKDNIAAARDKIQAAVVGLIMMVVVLSLIWTLEQIIFKRRICLGISCPVTLPSLLDPTP